MTFSDLSDLAVDRDTLNQVDHLSYRDSWVILVFSLFEKHLSGAMQRAIGRSEVFLKYLLLQNTLLFDYIGIELS